MKSLKMIESMIRELEETETPFDEYMKGYLSALKWVIK